jgi:hypothetical protein
MKILNKAIPIFVILAGLLVTQPLIASETNSLSPQSASLPTELENLLTNADTFTLFSINPDTYFYHKSTNTFQGYAILGQLDVNPVKTRAKLIADLDDGIRQVAKSEAGGLYVSTGCFNPRHGIRAKKGDQIIELLICFECGEIQIHSNDGKSWDFNIPTGVGPKPADIFNDVLKDAGVPLPKN